MLCKLFENLNKMSNRRYRGQKYVDKNMES